MEMYYEKMKRDRIGVRKDNFHNPRKQYKGKRKRKLKQVR